MDVKIRKGFQKLKSAHKDEQYQAFQDILKAVEEPVDWAYEVWEELLAGLASRDNHQRARSAQILCGLAKSDPEGRIFKDFSALLMMTKDQRFVTARHSLQALWKVGLAGKAQLKMTVAALSERFKQCAAEKNSTLIRYDIQVGLRNLYGATADEAIKALLQDLILLEDDLKYRKNTRRFGGNNSVNAGFY